MHILIWYFSDDGKYKRIPVYRGANAGYGFAEPFEFSSLLDLVLFYTENNLNKHSAELNTGLLYPAFYKQKRWYLYFTCKYKLFVIVTQIVCLYYMDSYSV